MERTIAIAAVIVIVVAAINNSFGLSIIQTFVRQFTGPGSGTQVSGDDE
jgi:hypothetical protein